MESFPTNMPFDCPYNSLCSISNFAPLSLLIGDVPEPYVLPLGNFIRKFYLCFWLVGDHHAVLGKEQNMVCKVYFRNQMNINFSGWRVVKNMGCEEYDTIENPGLEQT